MCSQFFSLFPRVFHLILSFSFLFFYFSFAFLFQFTILLCYLFSFFFLFFQYTYYIHWRIILLSAICRVSIRLFFLSLTWEEISKPIFSFYVFSFFAVFIWDRKKKKNYTIISHSHAVRTNARTQRQWKSVSKPDSRNVLLVFLLIFLFLLFANKKIRWTASTRHTTITTKYINEKRISDAVKGNKNNNQSQNIFTYFLCVCVLSMHFGFFFPIIHFTSVLNSNLRCTRAKISSFCSLVFAFRHYYVSMWLSVVPNFFFRLYFTFSSYLSIYAYRVYWCDRAFRYISLFL